MPDSLLIIDDEKDILLATRWALESSGYTIYTAANAEEAFRYFEAFRPQVILIDFKLPGASGEEFLKWVRDVDPNVPAIVITGLIPQIESIEALCRDMGVFACLRKPVSTEDLVETVRKAIENSPRRPAAAA